MPLKFRLKGLAETFLDTPCCSSCGYDGGDRREQGFRTDFTRVTYDGIIVVMQCEKCGNIFVPEAQRMGILNMAKLRDAVDQDCLNTGLPLLKSISDVKLEVERMNAERKDSVH